MSYDIKDISLWESGETKIQWVKSNMDLLRGIEEEFIKTIEQDTERDFFMDSNEALKYGLVDKII